MADVLHPGQVVPESGIYRVIHYPPHPQTIAELTFIKGRRFPFCPGCREVSFELIYADASRQARLPRRSRRLIARCDSRRGQVNSQRRPAASRGRLVSMLISIAILFGDLLGL